MNANTAFPAALLLSTVYRAEQTVQNVKAKKRPTVEVMKRGRRPTLSMREAQKRLTNS